jgi:prophage antirepressor-like protein
MLQLFSYESNNVRVVMIDDEPWFVARDICDILGIVKTETITDRLDSDEVRQTGVSNETSGRTYDMSVISESGVYTAIIRSDKPEAKKFRKWVTSEVLPTLRKTGHFSISPVNDMSKILTFIEEQTNINRRLLEDSNQLKQFTRKGISNPGCFNILNSDNDSTEQAVTAQQYLVSKGLGSWTKRHTFSKRAASALRVGKHLESLPMYNNNVLYYGEDVAYLEETLAQMLDLN